MPLRFNFFCGFNVVKSSSVWCWAWMFSLFATLQDIAVIVDTQASLLRVRSPSILWKFSHKGLY